MQQYEVVLLAPPFFRFCGSHNDRLCPSLTYLAAYLERAGISYIIVNGDATGAESYWSMRWMFDNYQPFVDAVDGRGSLYGEVAEVVMSFRPKVVVVAGAEPLIATKDWANPFIAAHFSKLLRKLGVYTVGIGHFFTLDTASFVGDFDCLMGGEPSEAIVDIVRRRPSGYVEPKPIDLDVVPRLEPRFPEKQRADFVMTSFGCRFPCSFCLVQQFYGKLGRPVRRAEIDTVVRDIAQRPEQQIYFTDLTFTMSSKKRLRELAAALAAAGVAKSYTIDTRADCLDEEMVDVLVELNVRRVKIGIEGGTQDMLDTFNKRTAVDDNQRAVALLKARGIEVFTYLLIGGGTTEADYEVTRSYIETLQPDFVPISIWAYDLSGDYRYDTQFSPLRLAQWGVDREIFYKYAGLQQAINPTVGELLDVH